jgi:hypothetical protein
MSTLFCQQFDCFVNFSVVRAISGLNAEKTLYECKKKQLQQAKCQSGTRRMIQKDEVLKESEDAQQIADRHRKEVEQAQHTAKLKSRREKSRKALKHQLDVLAALDNPNRLISCSEQAVSI